jgi:hypothetical protein
MRTRHCFRFWPAFLLVALGCSSDGGTEPNPTTLDDLAGTWSIEQWSWSLAPSGEGPVDWVATMGLSGALTVTASGEFTVTPALPGGFAHDFGTLTLQGDSLYWDGENDEEWVRFTLAGTTLTLVWPEAEVVDIDQDGTPEDGYRRVILRGSQS